MSTFTSLESFNSTRFAIRAWEPANPATDLLKEQILDFLDIVEAQNEQLLEVCNAQNNEQKQLEMALCHTEDAISIASSDGIIRMVNPSFEKLVGIAGPRLIGQNHDIFWSDEVSDKVDNMKTTIGKGCDWRGELSLCGRDGSTYEIQASVVPIVIPTGEVSHFVYTLHNITERKKLENSIRRQSEFLEKVINLNPSMILILDENGEWILDNLAAKTLLSDYGEGARNKISSQILLYIRARKNDVSQKFKLQLPNGSERVFLMKYEDIPATYLLPESDKKTTYLITLSDITVNEKTNRENLVRQKALLASRIEKNMIQGEFINGFIYHLQKPLNISKAAISRVQSAICNNRFDQVEQAVLLMRKELEFLEKELNKFRIIPQTQPSSIEWTGSSELVDAIKVLYFNQFQESLIEISASAIDEDACFPMPYEIMQLILKVLIDNAFEAESESEKDIRVKVMFSQSSDCMLLTVEDSGPGIGQTERYKIFEPFYTSKQNHSGLSLTILHQLINSIHGNVELSGSSMGGAKITLYFPVETA